MSASTATRAETAVKPAIKRKPARLRSKGDEAGARSRKPKEMESPYDPRKAKGGFRCSPNDRRLMYGKWASATESCLVDELEARMWTFSSKGQEPPQWSDVITIDVLAEALHVSRKTVLTTLARLLDLGIIEQLAAGPAYRYRPAPWNWADVPLLADYQASLVTEPAAPAELPSAPDPTAEHHFEPGKPRRIVLPSGLKVQPRVPVPCSMQFAELPNGVLDINLSLIGEWRREGEARVTSTSLRKKPPVANTRLIELQALIHDIWITRGLQDRCDAPDAKLEAQVLAALRSRPLEQLREKALGAMKRFTSAGLLKTLAEHCNETKQAEAWDARRAARSKVQPNGATCKQSDEAKRWAAFLAERGITDYDTASDAIIDLRIEFERGTAVGV